MPKFTVTGSTSDFGTDRRYTVYEDGKPIATGDPFHRCGIPVDPARRRAVIRDWARQIISEKCGIMP